MSRRKRICRPADIISNLPEAVLCHILSFVPTKSAVKTSILSKRWKYVWTKVPILDFTEFLGDSGISSYHNLTLKRKILFKSFVDRVLMHNDVSYVQNLRLLLTEDHYFHINSWLRALTKRDIRDINITLYYFGRHLGPVALPEMFLSSERLVVLKLNGKFTINVPMPVHLPNLETLWLTEVLLPDDEFMKTLTSSCPLLKELEIIHCKGPKNKLCVESLMLENLTIFVESADPMPGIVMKVPNLRYLCLLVDQCVKNIAFIGAPTLLNEADFDFESIGNVECANELMRNVCIVRSLKLYLDPEENVIALPIFPNLTSLKCIGYKYIHQLLECAPKLKSLYFEFIITDLNDGAFDSSILSKPVPKCITQLERVQINLFSGSDFEMQLLAYFLKFALVLKEITLFYHSGDIMQSLVEVFNKLLMLPRTSASCQIRTVEKS